MHQSYSFDPLQKLDPTIHQMTRHEAERQQRKLILIASESMCPPAIREALSSEFTNIYAEGYPSPRTLREPPALLGSFQHQLTHYRRYSNRRYYKGCEYVDLIESTLRRRTAEVFGNDRVKPEEIFVNGQPLSGAAANNAVYNAFVRPGDTVMGPALSHGGHLTHGSPVNRSGMHHHIVSYELTHAGQLDYNAIEKLALEARPKLIIGGFSAFPWDVDWAAMRRIADKVGAILLADISHLAGMVAAGLLNNPVGFAHVVSFTTHKTFCGPRGAMLLSSDPAVAAKVDSGVFPNEQGGPHIHQMAAKAVAMNVAKTEEFKALQRLVLDNAAALAEGFKEQGIDLAYGGTNTHLCLIDLRRLKTENGQPLTGETASRILDQCGIVCNKNTIAGDTNAIHPSALRFGTTWASQRGLKPEHMKRLAALMAQVLRQIHPFSYIGLKSEWGRGKIEPQVIEEANAELDRILEEVDRDSLQGPRSGFPHFPGVAWRGPRATALKEHHQGSAAKIVERQGWLVPAHFGEVERECKTLKEGVGLVDGGGTLLVEIGQGRAAHFLECACTSDIRGLKEQQATATALLDKDGKLLAQAIVLRLPADEYGYDRFWLKARCAHPDRLLRWLRGLSDGYLFHDEDLWLKNEGPAVVEDLQDPSDGREATTVVSLHGPQAGEVFSKAFQVTAPHPGTLSAIQHGWAVGKPKHSLAGIDLWIPVSKAATIWSRLREAGAQPVGCEAVSRTFPQALHEDALVSAKDLGGRVDLDKPFFVGLKTLVREIAQEDQRPAFGWSAPTSTAFKKTCLFDEHAKRASAKHIIPFAGWKMPVMYKSILDEHEAVRLSGGLFDVSHMGLLEFSGPHAERFLDLLATNYVPNLHPGQAHYSYLLDHDGRCIDDIIIYRAERQRFLVVVNAANADEDEAWFKGHLEGKLLVDPRHPNVRVTGDVRLRNLKDAACGADCRVDLALQGRRSVEILGQLADGPGFALAIQRLHRFELTSGSLMGLPVTVARTGYTGEALGFEIFVHPEKAPRLWNGLLETGEPLGLVPAGLGARDSLRCEAGYPLHGHELAGPHQIHPIEAGYGYYIKLHKPFFCGRASCLAHHQNRQRTVVRFAVDEKGGKVLRVGNPVLAGRKGEYAGVVTSAASTGNRQVGQAIVDVEYAKPGTKLHILTITGQESQPPARAPKDLHPGDWMTLPRRATVLDRFMKPGEKPLAEGPAP